MTTEQLAADAKTWAYANLARLKKLPFYTDMMEAAFIAGAAHTASTVEEEEKENIIEILKEAGYPKLAEKFKNMNFKTSQQ